MIYTEAFRRLGYSLEYKGHSAKRASIMADTGDADGEIHRICKYGNKHPNLIRVDEQHFPIYFSAYGIDSSIQINGWESLRETDFKIGYRRGIYGCESILPELVPKNRLMQADTIEQGLRQVLVGRTKIFIGVQRVIEEFLKTEDVHKYSNFIEWGLWKNPPPMPFYTRNISRLFQRLPLCLGR